MSYEIYQTARAEADKYNRKVARSALISFGIKMVEFEFSGGGDNGSVDAITLFKNKELSSRRDPLSINKAKEILDNRYPSKTVDYQSKKLQDVIQPLEEICSCIGYETIGRHIPGWDTSAGANGMVRYDVESDSFFMRGEISEPHNFEYADKGFPEDGK